MELYYVYYTTQSSLHITFQLPMKRELYENVFMNGAKVLQRHEERIVL
jgi:hypothetical protein